MVKNGNKSVLDIEILQITFNHDYLFQDNRQTDRQSSHNKETVSNSYKCQQFSVDFLNWQFLHDIFVSSLCGATKYHNLTLSHLNIHII